MKKSQLKQIIKEEVKVVLNEEIKNPKHTRYWVKILPYIQGMIPGATEEDIEDVIIHDHWQWWTPKQKEVNKFYMDWEERDKMYKLLRISQEEEDKFSDRL